jgi:hypothetical protein
LDKPLSALLLGESATGKSHLIDKTADLMPPRQVLRATRMTPQALYHLEEPIAHKYVVGGERSRVQDDARADQTAALRQLRSEGRISKLITTSLGNDFVTREVTMEGPIAFVESTTADKSIIFQEDLNRGLIITTDASEEQNRRVLREMAKLYSGSEPIDKGAILKRHRELQEALEPLAVYIPFIEQLAESLPAVEAQSRRVFGQVAATIEVIAFLHQHHRDKDTRGRLVATAYDYAVARWLLLKPLSESIGEAVGLTDATWRVYRRLKNKFPGEFTSTDTLTAKVFHTKPTRDKELEKLRRFGVLVCVGKPLGCNPGRYRWTGKDLGELVLPSVRSICVNA